MDRSFARPIVFGALFGALAFFMPFFLMKVFFFFLIAGVFIRFFGRRHFRGRRWGGNPMAFADRIRGMSDEEYDTFKKEFRGRCYQRMNPNDQGPEPTVSNA